MFGYIVVHKPDLSCQLLWTLPQPEETERENRTVDFKLRYDISGAASDRSL